MEWNYFRENEREKEQEEHKRSGYERWDESDRGIVEQQVRMAITDWTMTQNILTRNTHICVYIYIYILYTYYIYNMYCLYYIHVFVCVRAHICVSILGLVFKFSFMLIWILFPRLSKSFCNIIRFIRQIYQESHQSFIFSFPISSPLLLVLLFLSSFLPTHIYLYACKGVCMCTHISKMSSHLHISCWIFPPSHMIISKIIFPQTYNSMFLETKLELVLTKRIAFLEMEPIPFSKIFQFLPIFFIYYIFLYNIFTIK